MRLFLAIEVAATVRNEIGKRIAALRHRAQGPLVLPPARWVPVENFHLTLVFLGEQDKRCLVPLEDALAPTVAKHPPTILCVGKSGSFPPQGRAARVLWLGLEEDPGLMELQRDVAQACRRVLDGEPDTDLAGVSKRPYHPHITLARCREPWPRRAVEAFAECLSPPPGQPFLVKDVSLFESHLGPNGAHYRVRKRFPLAARQTTTLTVT